MSNVFPTKEKLSRLREYGIVPYSRFSTRLFCAGLVMVATYLLLSHIEKVLVPVGFELSGFLEGGSSQEEIAQLPVIESFFWLLLAPPFTVLLGTFLFGLFQTRFYAGGLGKNRDKDFKRHKGAAGEKTLLEIIAVFAVYLLALLAGLASMYLSWQQLARIFYGPVDSWIVAIPQVLTSVVPYLAVLLLSLSLVALFIFRFAFMLLHRMTYQDILEEQRES